MSRKQRRATKSARPTHTARSSRWTSKGTWAIIGLCFIHYTLAVTSVLNKSNTYDEIAHLTRGYSYFNTGDFRLEPPHPPLAHVWSALPGLGADVKFSNSWMNHASWHTSDVWQIGRAFFYYAKSGNADIIDSLLWRGRAMIALFSVCLGLLVYYASSRLFGQKGGLVSLALYAFSPTMLAHGRLVTTDCAAALFFACSLLTIWWMLHRISIKSVLVSGLSLAGLFLAKMSAVLIIPVGVVMLVARLVSRAPLKVQLGRTAREVVGLPAQLGYFGGVLLLWIIIVWSSIWAAYGFRYESMLAAEAGRDRYYCPNAIPDGTNLWDWQLRKLDHLKPAVAFLREHRLFPEAYIYSAVMSAQTARGRFAFLNGNVDKFGHRWFFPYAFLVKTPLALLAILVFVCLIPFVPLKNPEEDSATWVTWAYRTTPLWSFFVIYWLASLRTHINIGHRHILPIYPLLLVMCGAMAIYLRSSIKWFRWGTFALGGLFIASSLWTFPNYLSFFNLLAGGPKQGYKHLVDSSLDWGQDLPGVKAFLDRRAEAGHQTPVYFSYFGSGGDRAVAHFAIDAIRLPQAIPDQSPVEPYRPGTYLISATHLQQVYQTDQGNSLNNWTEALESIYQSSVRLTPGFPLPTADSPIAGRGQKRLVNLAFARLCKFLRTREPDDWINYSILVYELSESDLQTGLR